MLAAALIAALVLSVVDTGDEPVPEASSLRGTVVRVTDGDTVRVQLDDGRSERVRVLGIDAPELDPVECFGREASGRARELARGRSVRLVLDPTQDDRDRFDRLLAYVAVDGSGDLGRRLVSEGYATVFVFDRPFTRLDSYREAEGSARSARAGLWGRCRSGAGS